MQIRAASADAIGARGRVVRVERLCPRQPANVQTKDSAACQPQNNRENDRSSPACLTTLRPGLHRIKSAHMADDPAAPQTTARARLTGAFIAMMAFGWFGTFASCARNFNPRTVTQDPLYLYFIGPYVAAYGAGALVGVFVGRGVRIRYAKIVGATLCGAIVSGFIVASVWFEKAQSRTLFVDESRLYSELALAALPFVLPAILGGIVFADIRSRMPHRESPDHSSQR